MMGKYKNTRLVLAWIVFSILTAYCLSHFIATISGYPWGYEGWAISDWLINYEGGFVRRGLVGQVLFEMYQVKPYDVKLVIVLIYLLSSLMILALLYHILKKEGISPLFVLTGCGVAFTIFSLYGRRDFVMFIGVYIAIHYYAQYIKRKNIGYKILFQVISILLIFLHEASFFLFIPILFLLDFSKQVSCGNKRLKAFSSSLWFFSTIFLAFIVSCVFKGDADIARKIWTSWHSTFAAYPTNEDTSEIGLGVEALGWSANDTFLKTIKWTFMGEDGHQTLFKFPLAVSLYISSFYLMIHANDCDLKLYRLKELDKARLCNILLIQFLFFLPFFSFLSCDTGRNIAYWTLSSLFIYHQLPLNRTIIDKRLESCCKWMCLDLSKNANVKFCIYVALLLLTPFSSYCAPGLDNTLQGRIIEVLLHVLGG